MKEGRFVEKSLWTNINRYWIMRFNGLYRIFANKYIQPGSVIGITFSFSSAQEMFLLGDFLNFWSVK